MLSNTRYLIRTAFAWWAHDTEDGTLISRGNSPRSNVGLTKGRAKFSRLPAAGFPSLRPPIPRAISGQLLGNKASCRIRNLPPAPRLEVGSFGHLHHHFKAVSHHIGSLVDNVSYYVATALIFSQELGDFNSLTARVNLHLEHAERRTRPRWPRPPCSIPRSAINRQFFSHPGRRLWCSRLRSPILPTEKQAPEQSIERPATSAVRTAEWVRYTSGTCQTLSSQ